MGNKPYYIWQGTVDRLIGQIERESIGDASKVMMRRLDGTVCGPVDRHRLSKATYAQVNWAIYLGGTTIPPTGVPPHNCE